MGPTERDAKTATQRKNRRRHEETSNPEYQESANRSIQASRVRKKKTTGSAGAKSYSRAIGRKPKIQKTREESAQLKERRGLCRNPRIDESTFPESRESREPANPGNPCSHGSVAESRYREHAQKSTQLEAAASPRFRRGAESHI